MRALLPSLLSDAVGSPEHTISELNTQPADTPVQRFKCGLTTALAWLGARAVRYSFPVRLFHSLLHAGLSRRYPDTRVCRAETRLGALFRVRDERKPERIAAYIENNPVKAGVVQRAEDYRWSSAGE